LEDELIKLNVTEEQPAEKTGEKASKPDSVEKPKVQLE
jgi:hypothetical protein